MAETIKVLNSLPFLCDRHELQAHVIIYTVVPRDSQLKMSSSLD